MKNVESIVWIFDRLNETRNLPDIHETFLDLWRDVNSPIVITLAIIKTYGQKSHAEIFDMCKWQLDSCRRFAGATRKNELYVINGMTQLNAHVDGSCRVPVDKRVDVLYEISELILETERNEHLSASKKQIDVAFFQALYHAFMHAFELNTTGDDLMVCMRNIFEIHKLTRTSINDLTEEIKIRFPDPSVLLDQ